MGAWCCGGVLSPPVVPPHVQYVRPVPLFGTVPFICGPMIRSLSLYASNGARIRLSWNEVVVPVGQKAVSLTPSGV